MGRGRAGVIVGFIITLPNPSHQGRGYRGYQQLAARGFIF
jgi:hypothetical protein